MFSFILGFVLGMVVMWHMKEKEAQTPEENKPGTYKKVPWENDPYDD